MIEANAPDFWRLWYVGLIPDLATLRDRAKRPMVQRIYGVFALGWRGSVRHWAYHQRAYRLVAILVLPLILIMQSTVAFEFAVTLVPDWHETRQPLHFVATGLAQGLSIVLLAAVLLRWGLRLGRYIDEGDCGPGGEVRRSATFAGGEPALAIERAQGTRLWCIRRRHAFDSIAAPRIAPGADREGRGR